MALDRSPDFFFFFFLSLSEKNLQEFLEKGHQRYSPVKLFQNLTNGYGEKSFLRISSCPYIVQEAPYSSEPCFWADQNFANTF